MNVEEYHLRELAIAADASDPRHVMPSIASEHRRILDVGCGAGQTLIASALSDDTLLCGVDVELDALRLGKGLTQKVKFVCARGEALPFASGSFDLVVSRVALPYMNIPVALREFRFVLSDAGRIWLVLHPVKIPIEQLTSGVRRAQPKAALLGLCVLVAGAVLHVLGVQPPTPFRRHRYESFQTMHSITRALRRAGFRAPVGSRSPFFVVQAETAK